MNKLKQALHDIANPIEYLKRLTKEAGPEYRLDGVMAVKLASDPNFLRSIAEKALNDPRS